MPLLTLLLASCGRAEGDPLELGCAPAAGQTGTCTDLAVRYTTTPPADKGREREVLAEGCKGTGALSDVCARLGVMAAGGEGGPKDGALAAEAAANGCTREGRERPLSGVRAEACAILGKAARMGEGYPYDESTADRAYTTACLLGRERACDEVSPVHVALSPDGRWVAAWRDIGPFQVWSVEEGSPRFRDPELITGAVWSPDSAAIRLVGAYTSRETPIQDPSRLVSTTDWTAREVVPQLPLAQGWLTDGTTIWLDPEGMVWKRTHASGSVDVLRASRTDSVTCDPTRCVGRDGDLGFLLEGGRVRPLGTIRSWVRGSRLVRVDSESALDLDTGERLPIEGAMRDETRFRGLLVGPTGAWTLTPDRIISFDPVTFTPAEGGVEVPGIRRCSVTTTNLAGCAWDGEHGRMVVQHGGELQVIDLLSGRILRTIEMF